MLDFAHVLFQRHERLRHDFTFRHGSAYARYAMPCCAARYAMPLSRQLFFELACDAAMLLCRFHAAAALPRKYAQALHAAMLYFMRGE